MTTCTVTYLNPRIGLQTTSFTSRALSVCDLLVRPTKIEPLALVILEKEIKLISPLRSVYGGLSKKYDARIPRIKKKAFSATCRQKERLSSRCISPLRDCATASTSSFLSAASFVYRLTSFCNFPTRACLPSISRSIPLIRSTAPVSDVVSFLIRISVVSCRPLVLRLSNCLPSSSNSAGTIAAIVASAPTSLRRSERLSN